MYYKFSRNYRKAGITNGNRNERYVDNGQSQTYSNGSKYGASADQNNGLNSPMARIPPNNKIGNKQKVQNTGFVSIRLLTSKIKRNCAKFIKNCKVNSIRFRFQEITTHTESNKWKNKQSKTNFAANL